jgi:DNA repair protein RadC
MKNTFNLSMQMENAPEYMETFVKTPQDVLRICEPQASYGQEAFTVICLNTRNRVIAGGIISIGIADSTLVHPREVFRKALLSNACAIVCLHNHPSGDATPSAEDVKLTRQLVQSGQVLGVKVLDHVILGKNNDNTVKILSMRECGVVEFE